MTDRFGYGEIGLDINPRHPCEGCRDYEAPDGCKSNGGCGRVLTPEQFAECMRQASKRGEEEGHIEADGVIVGLLRALGYGEGADIFDDMPKWYS